MPKLRSMTSRISATVMTGVASRKIMLVAYMVQTKMGMRNHVMPGARMVWTVTTKLSPVRIDEKPTTMTPTSASDT